VAPGDSWSFRRAVEPPPAVALTAGFQLKEVFMNKKMKRILRHQKKDLLFDFVHEHPLINMQYGNQCTVAIGFLNPPKVRGT
jgi:hypothetical protein